MNTTEAAARLEADNEDVILIRVAGSCRIELLPDGLRDARERDAAMLAIAAYVARLLTTPGAAAPRPALDLN